MESGPPSSTRWRPRPGAPRRSVAPPLRTPEGPASRCPQSRTPARSAHARQQGHRAPTLGIPAGWSQGVLTVAESFAKARFLTVQEVAKLIRVSSMTVYRLIKAGDLPAVRVGRSFRVRDVDVDAYLESRYTQAG